MPDVEVRFLGDSGDAVSAAEQLDAVLETIRALAVQVTNALGDIKIGPSVVARFVSDAKVMEGALEGIEDQANDTRRSLSLIAMAAMGGPAGTMLASAMRGIPFVGYPGARDQGPFASPLSGVQSNQQAASRSMVPRVLGMNDPETGGLLSTAESIANAQAYLGGERRWPGPAAVGMLAAAGWGGGGMRVPMFGFGRFGFGGGINVPGARFGTPLALMGLDAMRLGGSTLGIAGSAVGGLGIGGGLYGLGILGTGAVGMGTDLAGIGQAGGDIKKTTQAYDQLQQAIALYGKNSTEAKNAQQQLNYTLSGFPAVARAAVLQASMTGQTFKAMFDRFTGPAEKTGAQIITQGMQTAEPFLPVIGRYASENMKIIQQGLQPLFTWLDSKKGGLGIFTQLEQLFQNRLPTAVHAGTQGFELFAHAVLDAANRTGNLLPKIDEFLTKLNTPAGLKALDSEIGKMMGLFQAWTGLFGSIIRGVYDLFNPAVSLGKDFAVQLTSIINKFRDWLNLGSTQSSLKALFTAHKAQLDAIFSVFQSLLPLAESFLTVLIRVEAAVARFTVGPIKAIADVISFITKIPFASTLLGWGAALTIIYKGANALFVRMVDGAKVSADSMAGITAATNLTTAAVDRLNVSLLAMGPAAAKGAAEADAAIASEGAVAGKTSLLGALGLGGIGARGGALLGGLKGFGARILPGALVGMIGGSIASSIVTPHIGNSTARSLAGNALQYGGIGAGIGMVAAPETLGLSVPIGAAAGAIAGLGVSLLGLMHRTDAAAQRMATFANDARDAGAKIRSAHQTISQTHVSLAQDKVSRDQTAQQLATDRQALAQTKKGTIEYAAALDQLRADEANYGQAVRQVAQDERTLSAAHQTVTTQTERQKDKLDGLRKEIDDTANSFRHQAVQMGIGNARLREFGDTTSLAEQRTRGFIARMTDLAKKNEEADPKLAKTYQDLAQIATNMNSIPTAKEIAVILKFGFDTGGLFGLGGAIAAAAKGAGEFVSQIAAHMKHGTGPVPTPNIPTASSIPSTGTTGGGPGGGGGGGGGGGASTPTLPIGLQLAIDKAATTQGTADDLKALHAAVAWVQNKIKKLTAAHASLATLDAYYQMLSGLQGQVSGAGQSSSSRISDLSAGRSALLNITKALHGNLLGGAQAVSPADIMGVHAVQTAHATWDPRLEGWRKQIREFDKELADKTISQQTANTIRARIDAITKHITQALTALKTAAQTQLQAASTAWSSFMQAFDQSYSGASSDSTQLDAARTQLGKDQLAVSLDSAQSSILGGTADTSMAQKVINDMATVLASPGGKPQPYTQQQIDNWLALWGDYYAKQGYTPQQMYDAFNKLLQSVGLPTIDNPFDTGGLPLPPGSGSSSGASTSPVIGGWSAASLAKVGAGGWGGMAGTAKSLPRITAQHSASRHSTVTHTATHPATEKRPIHVEVRLEKGLEWLDKHVVVLVDGEIKKQGEKANARARSGRW